MSGICGPFEATYYQSDGDRIRIYGIDGQYWPLSKRETGQLLETLQAAIAARDVPSLWDSEGFAQLSQRVALLEQMMRDNADGLQILRERTRPKEVK
jgi:hypothetical protein